MSGTIENLDSGFSKMIEEHLEKYFALHEGENIPPGLYNRVLMEVENTLFGVTLKYVHGNRLRAAQILGINRNTLRRKITNLEGSN